jgi:hypothetical protein
MSDHDDTQTIECVYCNHDVTASYDQVPSEHDEDFWTEEAKQHAIVCEFGDPDCEWVRTRAHRMEDDE